MPCRYSPELFFGTSASVYLQEVEDICTALSSERDLIPRKEVNELFSKLVHMTHPAQFKLSEVSHHEKFEVLAHKVQKLCSAGEYQLELYWSQRIAKSFQPESELYRFPYIENYRELTRLEYLNLLACLSGGPKRVLFIGSGPLPLSSYFLAKDYGCEVKNIDRSEDAVSLARLFASSLKIQAALEFCCSDVFEIKELEQYDVVFLAALVGEDHDEKGAILKHLCTHMAHGALCVIRSAYGLRTLLYPEVSEELVIKNGFRPVMLVHPLKDVVNSVLIGECIKERPIPTPLSL